MQQKKEISGKFVLMLFTAIFVGVGLIFCGVGILLINMDNIKSRKCTVEVKAVVVQNLRESQTTGSGNKRRTSLMYRPVFRYNYDGKDYVEQSNVSTSNERFTEGQEVILKINPDKPRSFYCPEDKTETFMGWIFAAIGGLFAVIGAAVGIGTALKSKKKDEYSEDEYGYYSGEQE